MSGKARTAALAAFIIGAGLFAIALVSGLLYEQVHRARDREEFPQIGRSVDIGGRALNLYCSGAGRPAVILESGATWPLSAPKEIWANGGPRPGYSWVAVQRELAGFTTACWYDRAGAGWSDLGPYPRDSASQARDLHALLQAAGVPSPYVLVAESSATLDARVYTAFYPAEVGGLVFVNAVDGDLFVSNRPGRGRRPRFPAFVGRSQDVAAQVFNRIGLYRLGPASLPAPPPKGMTSSEWHTVWHLTQSARARTALMQDIAAWGQSASEARAAGTLGDRPLIAISSESAVPSDYRDLWNERQAGLARLSVRGKQILVYGSGDDLLYQEPDAIVDAARLVVADVRQSRRPR